jgi:DNA-binding GntR family transcriptional regulator
MSTSDQPVKRCASPIIRVVDSNFAGPPLTATLPLQIAERIGALIVEERMRPGERLKEVELAESFRVSRATVREALRILEQRSLVSIVPQRGAHVTQLSRLELENLFEIRAVLLGLASRRVALNYSAEVKRRLHAGYVKLRAARGDATAYARASADLVAEITQLSGNQQLADYIADFALRIGRYTRLGLSRPERRRQSLVDWARLLRAIAMRNADEAERLHRRLSIQNRVAALAELERRERAERTSLARPKRATSANSKI